MPAIIVGFTAVFVGDFIGYWRHRLEHTRLLWPSHAVHHSDTAMTWLALLRFHPINRLSTFIIDISILTFLGFPAYALLVYSAVKHYYGFFIHADLPWSYGRLDKVFVSPVMHRWHHSIETEAHETNFATVFSFFDWILFFVISYFAAFTFFNTVFSSIPYAKRWRVRIIEVPLPTGWLYFGFFSFTIFKTVFITGSGPGASLNSVLV